MGISGEKLEKVVKSWNKWRKVGISGESWGKVGTSGNFFCITKNHFRSHFSPFQINTQLLFFLIFFFKMAAGRHFGSPFWAILDDRKSLWIAFLSISDQYATFIFLNFFFKMAAGRHFEVPFGPFWMTKNHFRSHFSPFQINTQLFFF